MRQIDELENISYDGQLPVREEEEPRLKRQYSERTADYFEA
jgi:hypothetical protein